MTRLEEGRYAARFAQTPGDVKIAQRLRWRAFKTARGLAVGRGLEADAFDAICRHLLIEDRRSGVAVACLRLMVLQNGAQIEKSYSAQFYDLGALCGYERPMAEVGRFCLDPEWHDPDILRCAWGALAAFVAAEGVEMLFGCSSFMGGDASDHLEALAVLQARHLAPPRWQPLVKSPVVFQYARSLAGVTPDFARAMKSMPPLLKAYLRMGGWVSDHAVVDRHLNTLHVFTGLEIGKIPNVRAQTLRNLCS
ncbi:MAG: GNAT family N-acyltransferase [Albidovulum sp.]